VSGRLLSAAHAPPGVEHVSRRAEETRPILPKARIGETGAAITLHGAGDAATLAASPAVGRDDREPVERLGTRWRMEP
jgi:hypothetical protein